MQGSKAETSFNSGCLHLPVLPQDSPPPIKHPSMLPTPGHSAPSDTVKHCGVGFPILRLYIKKDFKGTTGEALQGPRVFQCPQKENHLLVGKSLSSP